MRNNIKTLYGLPRKVIFQIRDQLQVLNFITTKNRKKKLYLLIKIEFQILGNILEEKKK